MAAEKEHNFLKWMLAVLGWLICAGLCLLTCIGLEAYPYAYDMIFPAILLILFCNILVFLFISNRWFKQTNRLFASIVRVCIGEGILLGCLYLLGRFCIG